MFGKMPVPVSSSTCTLGEERSASSRFNAPLCSIRLLSSTVRAPEYSFASSAVGLPIQRSEEHTSELQSLMRISYAVFCLKQKRKNKKDEWNTPIKQYTIERATTI